MATARASSLCPARVMRMDLSAVTYVFVRFESYRAGLTVAPRTVVTAHRTAVLITLPPPSIRIITTIIQLTALINTLVRDSRLWSRMLEPTSPASDLYCVLLL
jgi:hypothetical protein